MDSHSPSSLFSRLAALSESQRSAIESIIEQFERSHSFIREAGSDLVTEGLLSEFGDILRIHHCFSSGPMTKDKFERGLERAYQRTGRHASLAPLGNPGRDIILDKVGVSLKTQADRQIKEQSIHISKFMELGKGKWADDPTDLVGLRAQFLAHLHGYERILILRYFQKLPQHQYELLEIPKALLTQAAGGTLSMRMDSRQSPKPGTCTVSDLQGKIEFQLYFDDGTERKLQIRKLRRDLCIPHAQWLFPKDATIAEAGLP